MGDFRHNKGNGTLFRNDYKEEGSNQPDYRGSAVLLDDTDVDLSGWVKKDRNGKSYLSISIQKPYKKRDTHKTEVGKSQDGEFEDDIPF